MARVRGLVVHVPARRAVAVAYHEASSSPALPLRPLGRCLRNHNRTKYRAPPATPGPRYLVMSSRGRPHPATSAADVAMRPREEVRAPVDGTVVVRRRYRLYGRHPDHRIEIRPDGNRNVRVVVIHMDGVRVRRGDRVVAGETVLGLPAMLPFSSHVNDYVGPGIPHVHLEVKRRGA